MNVVWNNLSLNSKIIKMRISSFNSSKSWTSIRRLRSTIFRLVNSWLNSTARQNHFSSLSTQSMTWRQFLQSLSCSLTKHLNTNSFQWISSLLYRIRYRTFITSSLRQNTMIANSKTYWSIATQQIFRQKTLNNSRLCSESTKRHWFWIKKIIFFRFDIDKILFIDIVDLNISVDVITFHILLVQISFLLCLIDMNRLRLYFNNLINMFIEERLINKVLSRKEFYATHSNQIKRFQIQILMSSKSLTQKNNTILDFQIDMKASLIKIFKSIWKSSTFVRLIIFISVWRTNIIRWFVDMIMHFFSKTFCQNDDSETIKKKKDTFSKT